MEQKEEFDKRYLLMQPILSRTSRVLSLKPGLEHTDPSLSAFLRLTRQ